MATTRRQNCCKGLTKEGKSCRAAATDGGLCFFHANPNKATELGRIGGRMNRYTAAANAEPLPTLDSATAVRNAGNRLIDEVYSGKLNPKFASGLASLLGLQLRAIGVSDMERSVGDLIRELREIIDRQNGVTKIRPEAEQRFGRGRNEPAIAIKLHGLEHG